MIAVHIFGQIDHLKVECTDNLGKDHMVSGLGTDLNSLGFRDVLVCKYYLVFFKYIRGQLVDECLNCSCSMDVQRDIDDVVKDLVHNKLQDILICYLDELLAKVVSELIDHDVSDNWKHELNQILIKNVITACFDFLLEHSAPRLVKAVELDAVEDLLILHAQFVDRTFNFIILSRVTLTTLHG